MRMSISVLVLCAVVFAGLLFWPISGAEEPQEEPAPEVVTPIHLSLRCAGDIMSHKPQLTSAYDAATGTYSYDENYSYVKPYIEAADLALANVETTFRGDGNYRGYPTFNSPEALATAIKNAGFDVGITANNHMLDTGIAGVKNTIQVLRNAGLVAAGSRLEGENRSQIVEVNGLKVGIVAYTYESPLVNGRRTLNGSYIPEGGNELINSFRSDSRLAYAIDEDRAAIASEIQWCRDKGAQIVVTYLHWGIEYQRKASQSEIDMARFVAEAGSDVIFASHPHLLQGIDKFEIQVKYPEPEPEPEPEPIEEPEDSFVIKLRKLFGLIKEVEPEPEPEPEPKPEYWTKVVPVFYSMGNFISNQRQETLSDYTANAKYTEQGMIACVELDYNPETQEISNVDIKCIPTWVEKYNKDGKTRYFIIPLVDDYENNPELKASGHLTRAKNARQDVIDLVGQQYIYGY